MEHHKLVIDYMLFELKYKLFSRYIIMMTTWWCGPRATQFDGKSQHDHIGGIFSSMHLDRMYISTLEQTILGLP